jgi:aspartate/methionine/tyrosine aminotransferase
MFSTRTPHELRPNTFARLVACKRSEGRPLLDLTESNPTRAGFDYPARDVFDALANPRGLIYEPDPRGLASAREAVCAYYRARNVEVRPERVVLTASTSEAYGLLFKLLAEPGDTILVPSPSYPLFEHLARAEAVTPVSYPLVYHGRWAIDVDEVRATLAERARALVIVSPNNPTGSCLREDELAALAPLCRERGVALVCDEVFADYTTGADARRVASVAGERRVLAFALSGLSKVAALPQLKLGWIVVTGPDREADEATTRLEFLADLYLSVATPVQWALPRLFEIAPAMQRQIADRIASNRAFLEAKACGASVCRVLASDGGWYAVVRVPRVLAEEELVLDLLERLDLVVHPGYFFDFATEGWLVVSLITRPDAFERGVTRLVDYLDAWRG